MYHILSGTHIVFTGTQEQCKAKVNGWEPYPFLIVKGDRNSIIVKYHEFLLYNGFQVGGAFTESDWENWIYPVQCQLGLNSNTFSKIFKTLYSQQVSTNMGKTVGNMLPLKEYFEYQAILASDFLTDLKSLATANTELKTV